MAPGVTQGEALEQGPSQLEVVMLSSYSMWATLAQGDTKASSFFLPFLTAVLILRPFPPPHGANDAHHPCEQETCILKQPW